MRRENSDGKWKREEGREKKKSREIKKLHDKIVKVKRLNVGKTGELCGANDDVRTLPGGRTERGGGKSESRRERNC